MDSLASRDTPQQNRSISAKSDKREEIAPNLGLFDRPKIKQPSPSDPDPAG